MAIITYVFETGLQTLSHYLLLTNSQVNTLCRYKTFWRTIKQKNNLRDSDGANICFIKDIPHFVSQSPAFYMILIQTTKPF